MKRHLTPQLFVAVFVLGFASIPALQAQQPPPPGAGPQQTPPPPEDTAAYLAKLDAVPGYGGIAFGADLAKLKDSLELEQDRGSLKIYKAKTETLTLGPVLLDTVLFYFYQGKLYGVALHTDDGQDTLNLKSVFHYAFGSGKNSVDEGPSTIWIGKKVGALFEINTATGDGNAFLFDIAAHDAYLKYESEAAQKAADQLLKGK